MDIQSFINTWKVIIFFNKHLVDYLTKIGLIRLTLLPQLLKFPKKQWKKIFNPFLLISYCVIYIPFKYNMFYDLVKLHLQATNLCTNVDDLVLTCNRNTKTFKFDIIGIQKLF